MRTEVRVHSKALAGGHLPGLKTPRPLLRRSTMPYEGTPMPLALGAQPGKAFFYRVAQVAAILNVHRTTVYRAIESGDLPAVRLGQGRGGLRVSQEALTAYLAGAEVHPTAMAEVA
jgi:excisionase family DNA binding protein